MRKNKAIAKLVIAILSIVFLYTPKLASAEEQNIVEADHVGGVKFDVRLNIPSEWKVILPAKILLEKQEDESYIGNFEKVVLGQIMPNQTLYVEPVSKSITVVEKDGLKADVVATLIDNSVIFTNEDLSNEAIACQLVTPPLSAGKWYGKLSYNIDFVSETLPDLNSKGPGIYDKKGELLAELEPGDLSYSGSLCNLLGIDYLDVHDIVVPEGTTALNSYFQNCINLESVVIPDSVTTIGSFVFQNCHNLKNIELPSNLTTIDSKAFYNCVGIKTLYVPSSVTSIPGECNFQGIDTVVYDGPATYTSSSIYWGAKHLVRSLNEINDNVKPDLSGITKSGFYNINGDLIETIASSSSVSISDQSLKETIVKAVIPSGVTSVNLSYCTSLEEVILPDTITEVNFYRCSSLKNIDLPSGMTNFNGSKFAECSSLESITIPEGTTKLGQGCFYGCVNLKNIVIPLSVQKIEASTFYLAKLNTIEILNPQIDIANMALGYCEVDNIISEIPINPQWGHIYSHTHTGSAVTGGGCYTIEDNGVYQLGCGKQGNPVKETPDIVIKEDFEIDGTTLVKYNGPGGDVSVPNGITTIGNSAFKKTLVRSITIPDTVTTIEANAFDTCIRLNEVHISNSVTTIGNYAFNSCVGLTSITIPDSVTSIGSSAFAYCRSLQSVIIPNSITSISDSMFQYCSNLESIIIPDSVTNIGDYAFYYCTNLQSIIFNNSVVSIGQYAFYKCDNLKTVELPSSVKTIGSYAFAYCGNLTLATIPSSVTTINNNAFYNALAVNYSGSATGSPWGARCIASYIDENGIAYNDASKTTLLACPTNITTFVVPNTVTTIGSKAFQYCTSLTSVTIPNSVTSIDNSAFYNCESLQSITIPNSVTSIGNYAFYNCTKLESVTIPDSVTSIGNSAFYNVKHIYYTPGIITGAPWSALSSNGYIEGKFVYQDNTKKTLIGYIGTNRAVIIPRCVTTIKNSAFYNCTKLESVTIPNSVTNIGDSAFSGCTNLQSVEIPNSVTSIGSNVFSYCTNLKSATFPNSITSIGNSTFYNCTKLESVTIPNSVTSIGSSAFNYCINLISIEIPNSVTSIGFQAFYNCTNLSVTIPNTVTSINSSAFYNVKHIYYTGSATGSPWGARAIN